MAGARACPPLRIACPRRWDCRRAARAVSARSAIVAAAVAALAIVVYRAQLFTVSRPGDRPHPLAVRAPAGQPSSVSSGLLHGTSAHPPQQDQPGPIVILRVRALVPEKVKLSHPAQGTVRATVLAIDKESNHIKVQTEEGQRLMLFLPPASRARLQVGAPCLLQVVNRSTREASQSPERDEAFW